MTETADLAADADALIAARDRFATAHPEREVDLGGRRWGLTEVGGDGPALLLCPGTLGRGDVFWRVMERLAGGARVIAVTYPATPDLGAWSGDLARLLDHAGLARATVLGSSLGGWLAQHFAGAHPDRCDGLIAANTLASVAGLESRPPYCHDLEQVPIATLRDGFGAGLRVWREAHPDQAGLVALLLAEMAGRIPERHLRARLAALKHAPALPPVALPRARIAVIEAQDDPLISAPLRDGLRAALAPGAVYRFAWGGHFPYIARPALYAAAVEEMLGLTAPGAGDWGPLGPGAPGDEPVRVR